MFLDFSFVALFNLSLALFTLLVLYKAFAPLITKAIRSIRFPDEDVDFSAPLDDIRWKWLVGFFFVSVFFVFNPLELSISEHAERQKQSDMQVTREFKKDIPPRVEVEQRSLDRAIEEFNNAVRRAQVTKDNAEALQEETQPN